jgi:hypothetical protein
MAASAALRMYVHTMTLTVTAADSVRPSARATLCLFLSVTRYEPHLRSGIAVEAGTDAAYVTVTVTVTAYVTVTVWCSLCRLRWLAIVRVTMTVDYRCRYCCCCCCWYWVERQYEGRTGQ